MAFRDSIFAAARVGLSILGVGGQANPSPRSR